AGRDERQPVAKSSRLALRGAEVVLVGFQQRLGTRAKVVGNDPQCIVLGRRARLRERARGLPCRGAELGHSAVDVRWRTQAITMSSRWMTSSEILYPSIESMSRVCAPWIRRSSPAL